MNPAAIEIIRNQALNTINLEVVANNNNDLVWKQDRKVDFLDIKLAEPIKLTKIETVEDHKHQSNVLGFYLVLVDVNEQTITYKVIKLNNYKIINKKS